MDVTNILAHIAAAATAVAAAWWFFFTASFRKRVEFDLQYMALSDPRNKNEKLIELLFELQNKGQVESRCYTLAYEVQAVEAAGKEDHPVLRRSGNIVPPAAGYYYVRAGVTLRVAARFWIPAETSILRVKAFILYDKKRHEVSEEKNYSSKCTNIAIGHPWIGCSQFLLHCPQTPVWIQIA